MWWRDLIATNGHLTLRIGFLRFGAVEGMKTIGMGPEHMMYHEIKHIRYVHPLRKVYVKHTQLNEFPRFWVRDEQPVLDYVHCPP